MNLILLRFVLSVTALVSIVAFAAGVLFFGGKLTEIQVALLTLLASALIAEAKSSSAWIFDGVAEKGDGNAPPPTPAPAPAADPAPSPVLPPVAAPAAAQRPPPVDDAFVAVGAIRVSDGLVQTKESLAIAAAAWNSAHPNGPIASST